MRCKKSSSSCPQTIHKSLSPMVCWRVAKLVTVLQRYSVHGAQRCDKYCSLAICLALPYAQTQQSACHDVKCSTPTSHRALAHAKNTLDHEARAYQTYEEAQNFDSDGQPLPRTNGKRVPPLFPLQRRTFFIARTPCQADRCGILCFLQNLTNWKGNTAYEATLAGGPVPGVLQIGSEHFREIRRHSCKTDVRKQQLVYFQCGRRSKLRRCARGQVRSSRHERRASQSAGVSNGSSVSWFVAVQAGLTGTV